MQKLTNLRIKSLKKYGLLTIVHMSHLAELKAEKNNPIVSELLTAMTAVFNLQRASQQGKGEGQAERIKQAKIEKGIQEAREVLEGVDVTGYREV